MNQVQSKDGTKIAYEKMGNGEPLILVDGALCDRASGPNRPLAELLKQDFTVYIYDRRGRGDSGDSASYRIEREVEDLEALVQEAGGSAFVYGISSGAAVKLFMGKGVGLPAPVVAMMTLMPAWSGLKKIAHTLPYDTLLTIEHQQGRAFPANRWVSVNVSALTVVGGKSPAWMRNGMSSLAEALPNAKLHTLEGQTHIVKPAALAPVLKQYFNEEETVEW